MAKHIETGKQGENEAAGYLQQRGYTLLHRNWRHQHCEIDIIATRGPKLHFIEVKTRTTLAYGHPEESVTPAKMRKIMKAAEEFLYRHPQYKQVQYDVLAITRLKGVAAEFFLVEDVYL
jgi:putative endonuclease